VQQLVHDVEHVPRLLRCRRLQFYVRSTDDSANPAAVRFGAVLAAASS
jgi:hypothetical protein